MNTHKKLHLTLQYEMKSGIMKETSQIIKNQKEIAVIVAHPDDETLWCGGTILQHPDCHWFVVCLCRKNDSDRAPKFKKALNVFKAKGNIGDLDDGPEQKPLRSKEVQNAILAQLPKQNFDLLITHSPLGEYTRHLRHEEVGNAVIALWCDNKIVAKELWLFAYEDGNKKYYPKAISRANIYQKLPENIWKKKHRIITEVYGFNPTGFEAKTTPRIEGFWKFNNPIKTKEWLDRETSLIKKD